eukprot:maker-scaffold941_size78300-snap-gene-0.17 protein:Tk00813 transcript:maker-scaffold941_size78300-snap-gene-0.17-mRNA-1 annotation:"uncharacterized fam18-like protein"
MDFNAAFDPNAGGPARGGLKHPGVTAVHLLFRSTAFLLYLFGAYFSSSFIGLFVFIVLLLSLDFWAVKNVTGRIMVGLRWWNYIDDEGQSRWMFEAGQAQTQSALSPSEITLFWASLVLAPVLWLLCLISAVFRFNFQWLILVVIGLTLTTSNLLGYMRCRLGHTDLAGSAATGLARAYLRNLTSLFTRPAPGAPPTASTPRPFV